MLREIRVIGRMQNVKHNNRYVLLRFQGTQFKKISTDFKYNLYVYY